jgi:hypothetical protein
VPDKYPLPSGDPASLGFAATPLQHLDQLIRQHIEEGRYPGAQIALARYGTASWRCSAPMGMRKPNQCVDGAPAPSTELAW